MADSSVPVDALSLPPVVSVSYLAQFHPPDGVRPALVTSDGSLYFGELDRATCLPHGRGVMLFRYDVSAYGAGVAPYRCRRLPTMPSAVFHAGDRYGGGWRGGRFHGWGALVSSRLRYEGEWVEGRPHGRGSVWYDRGYVDCMPEHGGGMLGGRPGVPRLLWRGLVTLSPFDRPTVSAATPRAYVGELDADHLRHGHGRMTYYGGEVYEGSWVSNRRHGEGTMRWGDGTCYRGQWERDVRQGAGRIDYPNGSYYKGTMQHDTRDGAGVMCFANGDEYFGHFVRDHMSGQGTMKYRNGDVYAGEWRHDTRHGHGRFTLRRNGVTVEGEFVKGLTQGLATVVYPGVSTFVGHFERGERQSGTLFWHHPEHSTTQSTPKDVVTEHNPNNVVTDYNPNNVVTEHNPNNVVTDHDPNNVVFKTTAIQSEDVADDPTRATSDDTPPVSSASSARRMAHGGRWCYQGEWQGEHMHGKGLLWFVGGGFFFGDFVKSRRTGAGNMRYANGDEYSGDFVDEVRHGWGVQQQRNGLVAVGRWESDWFVEGYYGEWDGSALNGIGYLTLPVDTFFRLPAADGARVGGTPRVEDVGGGGGEATRAMDRAEVSRRAKRCTECVHFLGLFVDGYRDGVGMMWLPERTAPDAHDRCGGDTHTRESHAMEEEEEEDGRMGHGEWSAVDQPRHHLLKGRWCEDELHCPYGVWIFPSGAMYAGGFVRGQREGACGRLWSEDGSVYVGGWRDNAPHGLGGTLYRTLSASGSFSWSRAASGHVPSRLSSVANLAGQPASASAPTAPPAGREGEQTRRTEACVMYANWRAVDVAGPVYQDCIAPSLRDADTAARRRGCRRHGGAHRSSSSSSSSSSFILTAAAATTRMTDAVFPTMSPRAMRQTVLALVRPTDESAASSPVADAPRLFVAAEPDAAAEKELSGGAAGRTDSRRDAAMYAEERVRGPVGARGGGGDTDAPLSVTVGVSSGLGVVFFASGVIVRCRWHGNQEAVLTPYRPRSFYDYYTHWVRGSFDPTLSAPSMQSRYTTMMGQHRTAGALWMGRVDTNNPPPDTDPHRTNPSKDDRDDVPRRVERGGDEGEDEEEEEEDRAVDESAAAAPAPRHCSFCGKEFSYFRGSTSCALCFRASCAACLRAMTAGGAPRGQRAGCDFAVAALVAGSVARRHAFAAPPADRPADTAAVAEEEEDDNADDATMTRRMPPAVAEGLLGGGGVSATGAVAVCADCLVAVSARMRWSTAWLPRARVDADYGAESDDYGAESAAPSRREWVIYRGYTAHRVPHLCGEMWWGRGQYYRGGFDHGARHGYGVQRMFNGEHYTGGFAENRWHGEGYYACEDGSVLHARFAHGRLRELYYHGEVDRRRRAHGCGIGYGADGWVYNGTWVHGVRQGAGLLQYPDGSVYLGAVAENVPHGYGKWITAHGVFYGHFVRGQRTGSGVEFVSDGAVRGTWRDGMMHGGCRLYDGRAAEVYETTFEHGNERDDCFARPVMLEDREVGRCAGCGTAFGFFVRRHHCRLCGEVFCDACTTRRAVMPGHFYAAAAGARTPRRVCASCYGRLQQRRMLALRRYRDGGVYAGCWSAQTWVSRGLYCRGDGVCIVMNEEGQPLLPPTSGTRGSVVATPPDTTAAAAPRDGGAVADAAPDVRTLDALPTGSSMSAIDSFVMWWGTMMNLCHLHVTLDIPLLHQRYRRHAAAATTTTTPQHAATTTAAAAATASRESSDELSASMREALAATEQRRAFPVPPDTPSPPLFVSLHTAMRETDCPRYDPERNGREGGVRGDAATAAAALRAARFMPALIPPPPEVPRVSAMRRAAAEGSGEAAAHTDWRTHGEAKGAAEDAADDGLPAGPETPVAPRRALYDLRDADILAALRAERQQRFGATGSPGSLPAVRTRWTTAPPFLTGDESASAMSHVAVAAAMDTTRRRAGGGRQEADKDSRQEETARGEKSAAEAEEDGVVVPHLLPPTPPPPPLHRHIRVDWNSWTVQPLPAMCGAAARRVPHQRDSVTGSSPSLWTSERRWYESCTLWQPTVPAWSAVLHAGRRAKKKHAEELTHNSEDSNCRSPVCCTSSSQKQQQQQESRSPPRNETSRKESRTAAPHDSAARTTRRGGAPAEEELGGWLPEPMSGPFHFDVAQVRMTEHDLANSEDVCGRTLSGCAVYQISTDTA